MRKGVASSTVMVLGAIVVLLFTAYVVWSWLGGQQPFQKSQVDSQATYNPKGTCTTDVQCANNPDGSLCKKFSDPHFPERVYSFCSCQLNEDCQSTSSVVRSGVCGQDNICE